MAVIWKLKALLMEHQITPNGLAEHLKGQLSKTAIYNLVGNNPPSGINFETLNVLIPALNALTHQLVELHDLLEYQLDVPPDSWRSHINALGKK